MACDRCEDIHKAQRDGKTNQKCECDCHYNVSSSTYGQVCTCGQNQTTTGYCPVHGNTFLDSSGATTVNIPFSTTLRLEPFNSAIVKHIKGEAPKRMYDCKD